MFPDMIRLPSCLRVAGVPYQRNGACLTVCETLWPAIYPRPIVLCIRRRAEGGERWAKFGVDCESFFPLFVPSDDSRSYRNSIPA